MLDAVIASLRQLYLADPRPWMVGFSGSKDSSLIAPLNLDAVRSIPTENRITGIHFLCLDTRVEIPVVVETVEGTLAQMHAASNKQGLRIISAP